MYSLQYITGCNTNKPVQTLTAKFASYRNKRENAFLCSFNHFYFREADCVGSVTFSYASLYWISSVIFVSAAIYCGNARVITSSYNPRELWNIIHEYRVNLKTILVTNL